MLCYKDMTFCMAECANVACHRNLVHVPVDTDLPVAQADFSERCDAYHPADDRYATRRTPLPDPPEAT